MGVLPPNAAADLTGYSGAKRSNGTHKRKGTFSMRDLLYFSASWCGPCAQMSPVVSRVVSAIPCVNLTKIDIDDNLDLVREHQVGSVPTFVLLENGETIGTLIGRQTETSLREFLTNE